MFESTMSYFRMLSSLKISFAGMVALLAGVLFSYLDQSRSIMWIAAPLAVLAINLMAAIVYNARIRQNSGLLMFHICLMFLVILVTLSQLTSMKGRVEILQGEVFDSELVTVVKQGPLHPLEHLREIHFVQGDIAVDYRPGLRRGKTRSQLLSGNDVIVVGDNVGFRDSGYRFYTTSNKGYAAILKWHGEDGQMVSGAIHFPSYPLYDWKQENQWETPSGQFLKLTLVVGENHDTKKEWTLDSYKADGSLSIKLSDGSEQILLSGQSIKLDGGQLEFVAVRMWMGYSIFYNPWLAWFFATSIVGVFGLAWHYYQKMFAVKQSRLKTKQTMRDKRAVSIS